MNNQGNKILMSLVVLVGLFFVGNIVLTPCSAQNLGDWDSVLETGAGPDGAGYGTNVDSPEKYIPIVIRMLLSFLGVLFLVLMVYGGFLWMTARGNEEQVTKSKNLIIAAVIGLAIVLASYAISIFVVGSLAKSTLAL